MCEVLVMSEDYPIVVKDDGMTVKPKMMNDNEIYHSVYHNKLYLFFKDENELLKCYEVADNEIAEAIMTNPDSDSIKNILDDYTKKQQTII